jgi:hypothetical protein
VSVELAEQGRTGLRKPGPVHGTAVRERLFHRLSGRNAGHCFLIAAIVARE